MFDVYIRYWKHPDGTIDSGSEKKMFSLPLDNIGGFPIHSPSVKQSEDSADSFDFTMEPGSEYYDALAQMKTFLRVEYDGVTIFYGRVLTISGSTIYQTRSVHCEGCFAFLNDTYYEGTPTKNQDTMSWSTYLDKILSNHYNYLAGDATKDFYRGTISFTPTIEDKKFEPTGWSQTSACLNTLKDEVGGHMMARYNSSDKKIYLDWYKYYKRDLGDGVRPSVTVGRNILDLTLNNTVDNLFTRVIPVGKTGNDGDRLYIDGYSYTDVSGNPHAHSGKYMSVDLIPSLYSPSDLNDDFHSADDYGNAEAYSGIIYKPMEFPEADTQEKLWNECKKWIKDSYYGPVTSFEVRAIDMYMTGDSQQQILLGDLADVHYKLMVNGVMTDLPPKKLVCKAVKYDLFNPENNTYTFGVPSDLLKVHKSSQQAQESKTSKNGKTSASVAASTPAMTYEQPDYELTFEKIAGIIRNDPDTANGYGGSKTSKDPTVSAADSFIQNGRMAGSFQVYDADIHYDPVGHPEICFSATMVGKITLPNKTTKYIGFNSAHGLFAFTGEQQSWVSGGGGVGSVSNDLKYGTAYPTTHWYIKSAGYTYEETDPVVYDMINQAATYFMNTITLPENREAAITSTIAVANGILGIGKLMPGATQQNVLEGAMLLLDSGNKILDLVDTDKKAKTFVADLGTNIWNFLSGKSGTLEIPTISINANNSNMGFFSQVKNSVTQQVQNIQTTLLDGANSSLGFLQPVWDSVSQTFQQLPTVNLLGNDGGVLNLLSGVVGNNKQTITASGKQSSFVMYSPAIDQGNKARIKLFGPDGLVANVKSMLGTDGTGDNATITENGLTSEIFMTDVTDAGKTADEYKNVILDGNDGGTMAFEPVKDSHGNVDWKLTFNKAWDYLGKDEHGNPVTVTVENAIKAMNFGMPDNGTHAVPDFQEEFKYIDTVVVRDLYAVKGTFDKVISTKIIADGATIGTYVYADWVLANHASITTIKSKGGLTLLDDEGKDKANLKKCLISAECDTNTGVCTFRKADGSAADTFNMADTNFFRGRISAATSNGWTAGGKTAFFSVSRYGPLNPGESTTITPYYVSQDNKWKRSDADPVTILARSLSLKLRDGSSTDNPKITENGTYDIPQNYDGYGKIVVDVSGGDAGIDLKRYDNNYEGYTQKGDAMSGNPEGSAGNPAQCFSFTTDGTHKFMNQKWYRFKITCYGDERWYAFYVKT